MKTIHFNLFLITISILSFFSCTSDEDNTDLGKVKLENLNQTITTSSTCEGCNYNTIELTSEERQQLAEKFAPQLRFDRAARTFPMSAELIYKYSSNTGCSNEKISATLSDAHFDMNLNETESRNPIYTYYTTIKENDYIYIAYWWAYYRQPNCFRKAGGHDYDWEHITVKIDFSSKDISKAKIESLRYAEHSGYKTYGINDVSYYATTHPIVYVGKLAHPSYNTKRRTRIICASDYANPENAEDYFNTWDKGSERIQEMRCDKMWSASKNKWGKIGENPLYRNYDIW